MPALDGSTARHVTLTAQQDPAGMRPGSSARPGAYARSSRNWVRFEQLTAVGAEVENRAHGHGNGAEGCATISGCSPASDG